VSPQRRSESFSSAWVALEIWIYVLIARVFPIIKNGARTKHATAIFQQKIKAMIIPPINEAAPSIYGLNDSVAVPLTSYVSEAIALVNTLIACSDLSNHPIFFCRILL
jgi:hypothetical protein